MRNFKYPYEIDEFEIRRHQTSYSIDTALHLSNKYPGAELCWIIGADHIGKLSQLKQIEKLGKIISFICAVRNGYDTDETLIPQGVKLEFVKRSREIKTLNDIQGIRFTKDGLTFKASQISREFSFARLNAQLSWKTSESQQASERKVQQRIPDGGHLLESTGPGLFSPKSDTAPEEPLPQEELLRRRRKKKRRKGFGL